MTLQYRPDNDRLLYCDTNDKLMSACGCDSCADSVACHRFNACCDGTVFSERESYPHFIVIPDTTYDDLGDPACVLYNKCCYCNHDSTSTFPPNVPPGDVSAASETNCDSCNNVYQDSCAVCPGNCNSCTPRLSRIMTATFSGVTGGTITPNGIAEVNGAHVMHNQAVSSKMFPARNYRRIRDKMGFFELGHKPPALVCGSKTSI